MCQMLRSENMLELIEHAEELGRVIDEIDTFDPRCSFGNSRSRSGE